MDEPEEVVLVRGVGDPSRELVRRIASRPLRLVVSGVDVMMRSVRPGAIVQIT